MLRTLNAKASTSDIALDIMADDPDLFAAPLVEMVRQFQEAHEPMDLGTQIITLLTKASATRSTAIDLRPITLTRVMQRVVSKWLERRISAWKDTVKDALHPLQSGGSSTDETLLILRCLLDNHEKDGPAAILALDWGHFFDRVAQDLALASAEAK